jgi:hypothetical protein
VLDDTDSRPSMIDNTYVSMPSYGMRIQPTGVRRKGGGDLSEHNDINRSFQLDCDCGHRRIDFSPEASERKTAHSVRL